MAIVAVQQLPRRSVMLSGVPRGSSVRAVTPGPSSTAPQPRGTLQGFQPATGCLFGASEVGRQFTDQCCREDVTRPGADVDVPLNPQSREAVAEFGSMRTWTTSVRRMTLHVSTRGPR